MSYPKVVWYMKILFVCMWFVKSVYHMSAEVEHEANPDIIVTLLMKQVWTYSYANPTRRDQWELWVVSTAATERLYWMCASCSPMGSVWASVQSQLGGSRQVINFSSGEKSSFQTNETVSYSSFFFRGDDFITQFYSLGLPTPNLTLMWCWIWQYKRQCDTMFNKHSIGVDGMGVSPRTTLTTCAGSLKRAQGGLAWPPR